MTPWSPDLLSALAQRVGTPFWLYDAAELRRRIADVKALVAAPGLQARYAMKANSSWKILKEIQASGCWIDAVSANESIRAFQVGFSGGHQPPYILYTADVFRGNWHEVILEEKLLPNLGSPGMLQDLIDAGYHGPISLRLNVGFGHGHVNACDTGGPSSKHGIWWQELPQVVERAKAAGFKIVMLHAHVGSGPRQEELRDNLSRLARTFEQFLPLVPDIEAVNLGGGLPWNYRQDETLDIEALKKILVQAQQDLSRVAGRDLRLEIEPGRYFVVSSATLVARVADVKSTQTNDKGKGETFVMIDAGFADLVRPAMYGSYHRISIPAREGSKVEPLCVAGPLCESGDVFTRGADEMLEPRLLPRPERGDLLCIHDAGAYGASMSSNYNSTGRAPQIWREEDGTIHLISRRETLEDMRRAEVDERITF